MFSLTKMTWMPDINIASGGEGENASFLQVIAIMSQEFWSELYFQLIYLWATFVYYL